MPSKLVLLVSLLILCQGIDAQVEALFGDSILHMTITGDVSSLLDDRGEEPQYHSVTLSYQDAEGIEQVFPITSRARGNFRRKRENCNYPPLWLKFKQKHLGENNIFLGQKKLKLVTPCVQDRYVLQEYMAYKLYESLTPASFRTQLVKLTFSDTVKGKSTDPMWAFILEDEDQLAQRNDAEIMKVNRVRPKALAQREFLTMAVFEYLIGNTDWSIQYRHNIKLLKKIGSPLPIPVPYDFDHAGIVAAPYAKPAPELQLGSVRERRYRGYCYPDLKKFEQILSNFRQHQPKFIAQYENNPYLDARYLKQTLRYLQQFFQVLEKPQLVKREFQYPCLGTGTEKIIIRGLNK
ncbi:MAG: hypothetical protein KTR24_18430 [Saprospiraceae bacterium]|nr:hypothetical protein [Saprospiraceae bacterium]